MAAVNKTILQRTAAITNRPLLKQSAGLAVLAASNAGLAVLMSWYVVSRIGVNEQTDAFFASSAIPQFAFTLLTLTVLPVLVPMLATRADEEFQQNIWSFFSITLVVFILIGSVLFISAGLWVPFFVPGFADSAKLLTVSLTRIQLVNSVLNALIVTLWAAHHARQRFVWVEVTSGVANIAGMFFLALTLPRFGVRAAALNTVFYNGLKVLFLVPILGWQGWPTWRSQSVREAWRRLKPLLPGQAYLRTDPVVNRFLTSLTAAGTLSLFSMALQIYNSAILLTGKAIVAPMAPKLALDAREGFWQQYRRTYQSRFFLILVVTGLGLILLLTGAPFFHHLIVGRAITEQNFNSLWLIMIALGGMLVGGSLVQATAGAFYAMGDTKTPSKISAVAYTVFIPIKIGAFLKFGLLGLALSMTSYYLTNCLLQFFSLRREVLAKS